MRLRRAPLFAGRKPSKKKRSVGNPAATSAARLAEAPGIGTTRWPASIAARTSLKPGSGHQRRAGVRYQRQRAAIGEQGQQPRAGALGIVVVIGGQRRLDAVALHQPVGDAGVLAGDEVGAGQRLQRAHRDIAEIADRRRHDVQARLQARCGEGLPGEAEDAGARRGRRVFHDAVTVGPLNAAVMYRRRCGTGGYVGKF